MNVAQDGNQQQLISDGAVLLDLYDGNIAHVRLNRPAASNGMDVELLRSLHDAVMIIHSDPRVRVVLLSGEGKHFCAGGDIKLFASKGEQLPEFLRPTTSYLQIAVLSLMRLNAPVIAMVHGYAAGGGGLGLVCAADMVIAAESAKFLSGATRSGMAPDGGSTVTLARIVGFRKAMELLLTNRVIDSREALEIGLLTQVVADDQLWNASFALAQELAKAAPQALAATKRMLWNGIGLSVEAAMPEESRTVSALSGTADCREALAALIEKRAPKFTGN